MGCAELISDGLGKGGEERREGRSWEKGGWSVVMVGSTDNNIQDGRHV